MPRHTDSDTRQSESARLRRIRERLGITQRDLAEEFGVAPGAVAQWESGERSIPGTAMKLVNLYEEEIRANENEGEPIAAFQSTSWLPRSLRAAPASFAWFVLQHSFLRDNASPLGKKLRRIAMRNYIEALRELKSLAMKLGQMQACMDFLLPDADRQELWTMLNQGTSMSPALVARIFKNEMGKTPREAFRRWSAFPIATATIGQVHAAQLAEVGKVAVKIQYPAIVESLRADLENIRVLDRFYSLIFRAQQPGAFYEGVRQHILQECDYRHEAQSTSEIAGHFSDRADMCFAKVIPALSSERVLTMSFIDGEDFFAFAARASQPDRDRAGATIWDFFHRSIFAHGLSNIDPHPGNFLFPANQVAFLDFGRVQHFPPGYVDKWKRLIRATLERQPKEAERIGLELGFISRLDRFDKHHGHKMLLAHYLPLLADGLFEFNDTQMRKIFRVAFSENPNLDAISLTSEMAFYGQYMFGLPSVLSRLSARVPCRALALDVLYAPGEQRPPAYTPAELAMFGL